MKPPDPRNDTVSGDDCCAPEEKLAPDAGDPRNALAAAPVDDPKDGAELPRDSQLVVAPVEGLPNEGLPALANDENEEPPVLAAANPAPPPDEVAAAPKLGAELAAPKLPKLGVEPAAAPKLGVELAAPNPPRLPSALVLPNAGAGLAAKEKLGAAAELLLLPPPPPPPPPKLREEEGGGDAILLRYYCKSPPPPAGAPPAVRRASFRGSAAGFAGTRSVGWCWVARRRVGMWFVDVARQRAACVWPRVAPPKKLAQKNAIAAANRCPAAAPAGDDHERSQGLKSGEVCPRGFDSDESSVD